MNKKLIILLTLTILILTTFVSADNFLLNENRARINYDPPGDNDELLYSGYQDVYIMKSGNFNLNRITNNFSTFTTFYSTGQDSLNFMAFTYDNSPLMVGNATPTVAGRTSTFFIKSTATATGVISVLETNIYGVNAVNSVNTIDINSVTPLAYNIVTGITGLEFDTQTNLLYIMYNESRNIGVYEIDKTTTGANGGTYDASWIRSFPLAVTCGYTDTLKIDISLLNNQLYLLCGDKSKTPDRTVHTFSLLGDYRDTYTLNTLDNDYTSTTFSQTQDQMIVYDDSDKKIVFFGFSENVILGSGTVTVGGVLYNSSGLCINNNQYSENVSIYIDQYGSTIFGSPIQDRVWCSGGCINVQDNNNVYQGQCSQNACVSDCNQPNIDICETPNTYSICTVGLDGCTDLSSGLFCPANFICEEFPEGADCIPQDIESLGGLYIQPHINVGFTVNYTNAFEVLETQVDTTLDYVTLPLLTSFNIGVQTVSKYFLKTFASNVLTNFKITGIQQLQEVSYYGLSCNFIDNYLELDYLDGTSNILSENNITTINGTSYIDINTPTNKTLQPSSLSQNIELLIKPIESGTNYIKYVQDDYNILELEIYYNTTTRNLLIRETNFNKLLVNETSPNTITLSRIALITTHLKEADVNNIQLNVIRESNGIETEQIYYSLPIGYYNGVATKPNKIIFYNNDGESTLRLYQVIQREQSGFPSYSTSSDKTCEFTSLTCTNQVAFANDRNTPTYYFKEKIVSCVNQLGVVLNANPGDQPPIDSELDFFEQVIGKPLSKDQKVLLSSVVLGIVFGVFVFGYMETRANIVLIGGTVITGLFMLWFITIAYLPAWLILLFIVIGGFLVVGMFNKGGG